MVVPVCPSNPAPPFGTIHWMSPTSSVQAWARGALASNVPLFSTAYGVVDGAHVTARVEYQMVGGRCVRGITYYRPLDAIAPVRTEITTTVAPDPSSSASSTLALGGFAFVAFSTAFGLMWAFIRGESR